MAYVLPPQFSTQQYLYQQPQPPVMMHQAYVQHQHHSMQPQMQHQPPQQYQMPQTNMMPQELPPMAQPHQRPASPPAAPSKICTYWQKDGRCPCKKCPYAASHTAENSPRYAKAAMRAAGFVNPPAPPAPAPRASALQIKDPTPPRRVNALEIKEPSPPQSPRVGERAEVSPPTTPPRPNAMLIKDAPLSPPKSSRLARWSNAAAVEAR